MLGLAQDRAILLRSPLWVAVAEDVMIENRKICRPTALLLALTNQISRNSPGGVVLGIAVIVGGVALLLAFIEDNLAYPGIPGPPR